MLRRVAALLLIATSGWLLYQTTEHFIGIEIEGLTDRFVKKIGDVNFVLPAIGGVLGLLGGLVVLFGGVGGAALALVGGVIAAGFSLYIGKSFWTGSLDIWNNEAVVGLTILILAALAALMGRD